MRKTRQYMTNEEFARIAMPLVVSNATYREIGAATGLSVGGVVYKLNQLGLRKPRRFARIEAIPVELESAA